MRRFIHLAVLLAVSVGSMTAQQQDTVIFDPSTGNFNIRYTGVVTYARDSLGTLRVLKGDEISGDKEEVIERDSVFTAAFEPGTKMEITLECAITRVADTDILEYTYTPKNSPKSIQAAGVLIVTFGKGLQVSGKSPNKWYGGQDYEKGGGKLANQWSWFPIGKNSKAIPPGTTLDGFALQSISLPILGNVYIQGQTRRPAWPAHFKNTSFRNSLSRLWVLPANYLCLRTIVPGDMQVGVEQKSFLDTLISYKHQALALRWIDNEGIANSLDQKLENARQQLSKGNTKAARNMLEAFVNEVEAQNGKHLTSEAYALLKFNAEYLIDHLPGTGKPDKK